MARWIRFRFHGILGAMSMVDLNPIRGRFRRLQDLLNKVLLGKPEIVELALVCLLARGHLLLEDLPGVGKTTLASALAKGVQAKFNRIQFTADLLPSDILGTRVYRRQEERFEFVPGPIFSHFVLADELNRAPPKTQSALLQAMNEGTISVERETHPLPDPFMVVATQNPRGYHGTYPLPESQRDRFLMRIAIGYPDDVTETRILSDFNGFAFLDRMETVMSLADVTALQGQIRTIATPEEAVLYLVRLVQATRTHEDVLIPISPRGSLALLTAAQALAFIRGQTYIDIDVLKELAPAVLAHRLALRIGTQNAVGEGASIAWVEHHLLRRVAVQ